MKSFEEELGKIYIDLNLRSEVDIDDAISKLEDSNLKLKEKKLINLGYLYLAQDNASIAEKQFTKAVEIIESPYTLSHFGFYQYLTGNYIKAKEALLKAIELDSNDIELRAELVTVLLELGELDTADKINLKNIKYEPLNPKYYSERAQIATASLNFESAIYYSSFAILLDPNNSLRYSNRGVLSFSIGAYSESLVDLSKAINLNPDYPNYYLYRASANNALGNFNNASNDLETSLNLGLDNINKGYLEAKFNNFYLSGEIEKAFELYKDNIDEYSNNSNILYQVSTTLFQQENYQEALETIYKAISIESHIFSYTLLLFKILSKIKDNFDDAILLIENYKENYPMNFINFIEIIEILIKSKEINYAKKIILEALESYPESPKLYNLLCSVYHETGDKNKYEKNYKIYEEISRITKLLN